MGEKGEQVEEDFNGDKIVASIIKETTLSSNEAMNVAVEALRMLCQFNVPFLTAPMIREVSCIAMLKLGHIRARFEYTRIGMPQYDLYQLALKHDKSVDGFLAGIGEHVKQEWELVSKALSKFAETSGGRVLPILKRVSKE
jgi:anaerobic ribonucleoside-triphosphate reductase